MNETVFDGKQRIIQEFVPGKQVTLAHLIANPNPDIYKKLGVIGEPAGALGILTITPSEGAIIGADIATKSANVDIVFVDRFNGSLVIGGDVASVEAAVRDVLDVLEHLLRLAGADPVFTVSAFTGEGVDALLDFLRGEEER